MTHYETPAERREATLAAATAIFQKQHPEHIQLRLVPLQTPSRDYAVVDAMGIPVIGARRTWCQLVAMSEAPVSIARA